MRILLINWIPPLVTPTHADIDHLGHFFFTFPLVLSVFRTRGFLEIAKGGSLRWGVSFLRIYRYTDIALYRIYRIYRIQYTDIALPHGMIIAIVTPPRRHRPFGPLFQPGAVKLVACFVCKRTFLPDRLDVHLNSCKGPRPKLGHRR